jgi:hypothetical protein
VPQTDHYFYFPGDVDYVKFGVGPPTPITYTIWTTKSFAVLDTVLTLYDVDGTTELRPPNDESELDPADWPFSGFVYRFDTVGTYYLKAEEAFSDGGCEPRYQYTIAISPTTSLSSLISERPARPIERPSTTGSRTDVFLPLSRRE